jgi:two-component system LytT family response regulator
MERNQLGVLIVENQVKSYSQLKNVVERVTPISFCVRAEDTDDALMKVVELNPDIVFLEYPLIGKTGSGFIKFLQTSLPGTTIVFVSESTQYAIEAIHYEVYDYVLKPVNRFDVVKIVEKVLEKKKLDIQTMINEIIENKFDDVRLRLNTSKGLLMINPDEIVFCKSDCAYTELHLTNRMVELSSLSLGKIQEILNPQNFLKVSRSIIINRNYFRKIIRSTGVCVLSANGVEYEIKGSKTQLKFFAKIDFE